jgi:hypothetical protein
MFAFRHSDRKGEVRSVESEAALSSKSLSTTLQEIEKFAVEIESALRPEEQTSIDGSSVNFALTSSTNTSAYEGQNAENHGLA